MKTGAEARRARGLRARGRASAREPKDELGATGRGADRVLDARIEDTRARARAALTEMKQLPQPLAGRAKRRQGIACGGLTPENRQQTAHLFYYRELSFLRAGCSILIQLK